MAFVQFTQVGRGGPVQVTLTPEGIIRPSQTARRAFELDKYSHVVLYFDAETARIGIQPTNDARAVSARRLARMGWTLGISVKAFLAHFGIARPECNTYYPIALDAETGYLVIRLRTAASPARRRCR